MKTVFHAMHEVSAQAAIVGAFSLLRDPMIKIKDVVVVGNGSAVKAFIKKSKYEQQVVQAVSNGIKLRACKNSLNGLSISEKDLLNGVEIVFSGVGELTRLQSQGYAYIRI